MSTAAAVTTAEVFADRLRLERTGSDTWKGFHGGDGYGWAFGLQERGIPWLIEANGWPYRIISRGADFLVEYVEGDVYLTRYGIDSESGYDLETAARMYDRRDLDEYRDVTEADRFAVIEAEDAHGIEEVRAIIAAYSERVGVDWGDGPDWDEYLSAMLPVKYAHEVEEWLQDAAIDAYGDCNEVGALPAEIANAIDWLRVGADLFRPIEYGGRWFDVSRWD